MIEVGDKAEQRVYLVDDDSDDCFLFDLVIKQHFPQVTLTCFYSGDDLMTALETVLELPCIIFLDYRMPGQTGLEIATQLQRSPRFTSIPIALLSGQAQGLEKNTGNWRSYGKPNNLLQLQTLITESLNAL